MATAQLSVRVDPGIDAIAASPRGSDIVLAARAGLYVLDLHDPYSLPRWMPLRSAAEVANIQWCPDSSRPTWVVSTSNATGVVWNLALPSHRAVEHVLRGHRRAVTDVNFGLLRPDLLVTASIDTTVRAWDLRAPGSSTLVFEDFVAGAAQAKWSPKDSNQIVSAHDSRFVLWDARKHNRPLLSVRAHTGKLNGLSFDSDGHILTCSTDRKLKRWDISALKTEQSSSDLQTPMNTIVTDFPIWRAKPTPIGHGCFIAPLRGGCNNAILANINTRTDQEVPLEELSIATYTGHEQAIRDVIWRRSDTDGNIWDLVTWSRDSNLRIWNIPDSIMAKVAPNGSLADVKYPRKSHVSYHAEPQETTPLPSASRTYFDLPFMRQQAQRGHMGQLDWIAGVQVGNQMVTPENMFVSAFSPSRRRESLLPHSGSNVRGNGSTKRGCLSHEVTHVSTTFPKIIFEMIDVATGLCVLTLRGPVDSDENFTLLRVSARFPPEYPWQPAHLTIEEDPNVPPNKLAEMDAYLEEAAKELAKNGVPALEFAVRYLMGEKPLLEAFITAAEADAVDPVDWSPSNTSMSNSDDGADSENDGDGDFNDDDDYDDEDDDDEDDDDDADDTDISVVSDRIEATAGVLGDLQPKAVDNTPLPRRCGAVFSASGILITFFNRKPEDAVETGPLPLDRVFGDSEGSDSNMLYASDSDDFETPEGAALMLGAANWSAAAVRITTAAAAPSSNAKVPQGSRSLNDSAAESDVAKTADIELAETKVTFTDFNSLMPSRPDVAARYRLDFSGEDPAVLFQHNASVATELGLPEDAYFWRLGEALLFPRTPSTISDDRPPPELQLPFINEWGNNPLGPRHMLQAAADYLEARQKVQLLASLACVLLSYSRQFEDYAAELASVHEPSTKYPDAKTVTTFQFTTTPQVIALAQRRAGTRATTPLQTAQHYRQASVTSTSWNGFDFSATPTPRLTRRGTQVSLADTGGSSSSPNTALGSFPSSSIITAAIPSAGRHAPSISSLAPGVTHSPAVYSLSGLASGTITPSAGSMLGSASQPGDPGSLLGTVPPDLVSSPNLVQRISLQIVDHAIYDTEGVTSGVPAVEGTISTWKEWRPRLEKWRRAYAHLLGAWGLEIARLEVLKDTDIDDHGAFSVSVEMRRDVCIYCGRPIRTRFSPCEICQHVMHSNCSEKWWVQASECPSGCGCKCPTFV